MGDTPPKGDIVHVDYLHHDVTTRSHNTTDKGMEEVFISTFGKKLTPEQMKGVTMVRVAKADIPLIRGGPACHVSVDVPVLQRQNPAPYCGRNYIG
jgi:hypothetical protein